MQNRVFFSQGAVDQWGIDGKVDLSASELIVLSEGRTFKVVEAVHVVTEVTGANDKHELVGKVKPKSALEELGAEILETSMILGDNAYDVVPGWMGTPSTTFSEHLVSDALKEAHTKARAQKGGPATVSPSSDEELLRALLE